MVTCITRREHIFRVSWRSATWAVAGNDLHVLRLVRPSNVDFHFVRRSLPSHDDESEGRKMGAHSYTDASLGLYKENHENAGLSCRMSTEMSSHVSRLMVQCSPKLIMGNWQNFPWLAINLSLTQSRCGIRKREGRVKKSYLVAGRPPAMRDVMTINGGADQLKSQ